MSKRSLFATTFLAIALTAAAAQAGTITIIDTFGPGDSYSTASPYTTQYNCCAFAAAFMITQPTVVDTVKVAGRGSLQLRWATNNGNNLPTTPFFGGVGLPVSGVADATGDLGTLLPGTYWIEYLSDFMDPAQNLIYKNDQDFLGPVALNTTVNLNGLIDQTAWYGETGVLPAIALYGHSVVSEPASITAFVTGLLALMLAGTALRRRNPGR